MTLYLLYSTKTLQKQKTDGANVYKYRYLQYLIIPYIQMYNLVTLLEVKSRLTAWTFSLSY